MVSSSTRVIQITNIAPQATKDQMQTLFGYLGKIDDIRLYPTIRDVSCPVQSRICYVKYYDSSTVSVAQHMTNTVFIDRALIVIPMQTGEIPDEQRALELSNNGTIVPGLSNSEPRLPAHVENTLDGVPPNQVVLTTDPNLAAAGLPPYPPLPASCDTKTIEEIRRTVLVVDTGSLGHHQLIDYFGKAGEVKYLRFCERDDKLKYALIEMSEQESIIKALQLNSTTLDGHTIKVQHATQAINKPQTKSNEAAQREIEEAMCRVKEAQTLISAAIDPVIGLLSKDKRRTRSRSRSRRRSRSRSRRSRSRRKRSRSRSRHRSRRSRSRSRHRHRSRSRSRHRSSRRSRSRSRHRSSRSKRDRSRDRDRKDKDKKESDKDKKESDKDKKDRSKSPVKVEKAMSKSPPKDVEEKKPDDQKEPKPETNNGHSDGSPKAAEVIQSSVDKEVAAEVKAAEPEKEEEKSEEKKKERSPSRRKERSRSKDRKRDRSRSKRRSRSRSRKKRSRSRRRSRSRDRKRSRSRDRKKRSRSRKRSRDRSRDRKRSRSRDRKRTRSRDRKRSRSRDRKRSRSASRRSRSHRDSKTPHDMKSRERTPLPPLPEEKGKSIVDNSIDIGEEKNSPDNMDISNSP